jgi:hypothetical protein
LPFTYGFWDLAYLLEPNGRRDALSLGNIKTGATLTSKKVIPPDEHFACFDDLYGAGALLTYEWERDISPAWRFVGRFMRFVEPLEDLANQMLRRAMGLSPDDIIPAVCTGDIYISSANPVSVHLDSYPPG